MHLSKLLHLTKCPKPVSLELKRELKKLSLCVVWMRDVLEKNQENLNKDWPYCYFLIDYVSRHCFSCYLVQKIMESTPWNTLIKILHEKLSKKHFTFIYYLTHWVTKIQIRLYDRVIKGQRIWISYVKCQIFPQAQCCPL